MRIGNKFSRVCLCVCLFICVSVCVSSLSVQALTFDLLKLGTLTFSIQAHLDDI